MQLTDLSDIQLVDARTIGIKSNDQIVKLTFKNGKKEEELVLFPGLFCHALGLDDDGLPSVLKNKEKLLDNARACTRLGTVLQKFW